MIEQIILDFKNQGILVGDDSPEYSGLIKKAEKNLINDPFSISRQNIIQITILIMTENHL